MDWVKNIKTLSYWKFEKSMGLKNAKDRLIQQLMLTICCLLSYISHQMSKHVNIETVNLGLCFETVQTFMLR